MSLLLENLKRCFVMAVINLSGSSEAPPTTTTTFPSLPNPRWWPYISAVALRGAENTKVYSLIGFICEIAVQIWTLSIYIPMTGMWIVFPTEHFFPSPFHLKCGLKRAWSAFILFIGFSCPLINGSFSLHVPFNCMSWDLIWERTDRGQMWY